MREAVSLATLDGLEGLSIGNLADALDMSKSGVYAHFGSKQDLQLATVDEAGRIFQAEVIEPALAAAPGLAQLVAVCDAFFDHLVRRTFPGGCFFAGAALEMGTRPGPVKEQIAAFQGRAHRPDPPVRRHRPRTARAPCRRGSRRAHLRAERHHPRRQHQLRAARGPRHARDGPRRRPPAARTCPEHHGLRATSGATAAPAPRRLTPRPASAPAPSITSTGPAFTSSGGGAEPASISSEHHESLRWRVCTERGTVPHGGVRGGEDSR